MVKVVIWKNPFYRTEKRKRKKRLGNEEKQDTEDLLVESEVMESEEDLVDEGH